MHDAHSSIATVTAAGGAAPVAFSQAALKAFKISTPCFALVR